MENITFTNTEEKIMIKNSRGYACVGLVSPKTPSNIGSVLRAAGCYDVKIVAVSGKRYKKSKKFNTDTRKQYRHRPFLEVENIQNIIPYSCIPIAVDLTQDAKSIFNFIHPERAFYIFGSEDGTLGKSITSWCKETIYIPTNGCMNLAAAVNVILYDRMLQYNKRSHNDKNKIDEEK